MLSYRNYTIKRYWRELILSTLLLTNIVVWISVSQHRTGPLRVYFLDVGQGDGIFVDTPSHKHFLLDAGRTKKVVTQLGQILPFGDRNIDVMIESHPDADHIGGLPEVVSRYNVGIFFEPGVESPNTIDDELHARVQAKKIPDILARRGMVINFGDGVKLTFLFPNQDVSNWETNDASIVAKLTYGDKSFLLTGDSTFKAENILMSLNKEILKSTVLKAGHHGSKYSTSLAYAQAVAPEYGVISVGTGNTYGHPSKEALNNLSAVGAKILSTETVTGKVVGMGTIEFDTDGTSLTLK